MDNERWSILSNCSDASLQWLPNQRISGSQERKRPSGRIVFRCHRQQNRKRTSKSSDSRVKKNPRNTRFLRSCMHFLVPNDYLFVNRNYLLHNSERLFSGIFQAFVRYLCFTHKTPSCFPLFYYIITARIVHAPILRRGKGRRLFWPSSFRPQHESLSHNMTVLW